MIITYVATFYGFTTVLEKKTDSVRFTASGRVEFTDSDGCAIAIDMEDILTIEDA